MGLSACYALQMQSVKLHKLMFSLRDLGVYFGPIPPFSSILHFCNGNDGFGHCMLGSDILLGGFGFYFACLCSL